MHPMKRVLGAAVFVLLPTQQASAVSLPDLLSSISIGGQMMSFDYIARSASAMANPDGTFSLMGGGTFPVPNTTMMWEHSWTITGDPDPYIDATLSFTNLTNSTQTFAVSLNLPVTVAFAPAYKTGTLGYSFQDANNDGAAGVSNIGWTGLIDGAGAMNLFAASTSCSGNGCSFNLAPVSQGPVLHAAGVSSSIGIDLSFDLSAGDTVTFNTRFEVTPVPIPAAFWLFGSGLAGLLLVHRRARA